MAKRFCVKKFISTELHNKILIEMQHLLYNKKKLPTSLFVAKLTYPIVFNTVRFLEKINLF